ncbi:MAG: shufflon system plasmid conjugative transfer pilus tip adhesin PilV [Bacteroides sp.]|nr:shufflon system plasmid conjugative transfer pilus tip adhesin PilV [Bacteroides sp.]
MIDIYSVSGKLLASPLLGSDAERVEELMANDYVQLAWQSDSEEILPAGTYVMYEGERFSLLDPYEPEQKDEAEWSYRPQFQSRVMGWGKVPFFHYVYSAPTTISAREPDWTLTDTPANFMAAICRAIKNEIGEAWTYEIAGDLIGQSATISFAATDILSGLNAISGQFDTEWRADKATNTLYLGKAQFGAAITLEVDANVGVPSVTRSKEGYYNRFYIYGSTRNITQDYQGANVNGLVNKRLTLDPAKFPGGHIDLPRAAGVPVYAKTLTFDEVYPHSGLTIANLRARLMYRLDEEQNKIQVGTDSQGNPVYDMYTIWFFQLPGFSLNDSTYGADNPDGMLIAGKALSIHFKSGALTGREFELIYHPKAEQLRNSDGQDFSVLAGDYEIKFKEESGLIIPMQTGIVPADGDEVILFNLRMPAEYIATAYAELEATALKEIEERYTTDLNNYTVKSNPVAFADADPGLSVGRKVQYVNGDYSYTTRVIKLVRKLDVPSEQEITIGSEKIKGNTATLKEEVVSANSNIDILTQLNQLNQSAAQAYQRTQQMMLDSIAKMENYWVYDPANDTIWTPYNVLSRKEVTAYGGNGNAGGEDVPGVGTGATRLRFLEDVLLPETEIADDSVLTFDAQTGMWVAKQVKSGLDTSELAAYLREHDYARLSDIPALPDLSIYATQDWVTGKGYALASALDNYVTIATPQEVSGQKRFSQSILLGTADDHIELSYSGGAFRVSSNFVAAGEVTAYGSADYETFGGARKLDDLTDVSLGAIAVGDVLSWDGAKWTNKTISQGLDTSAGDARWVLKAGDTMSGALNMAGTNKILLNGSDFGIYADNYLRLKTAAGTIVFNDTMFRCDDSLNGKVTLGGATSRWSNVYANTINVSSTAVVSNLNADMLDGRHSYDYMLRLYSLAAAGSTLSYTDWLKTNGATFGLFARNSWGWGNSATITTPYGNLNTESYSALVFRQGNLNGAWAMAAAMFLPAYNAESKFIYIAQARTDGTAGTLVSPRMIRYADYDTVLASNVASASKLQTARSIYGVDFDGSAGVNGAFFWRATDATLRIYEATGRNSAEGVETLCLQSCFDGQDPQTSNYVTLHAARCVLALQPRGGRVAIGKTTADYPLDVNGTIAVNHPDYHAINLRRITSGAYGCSIGFTTGEGAFVGDIGFDGTKYFNVRNASGTTLIAALQNGNVGFGTTTPRYKADIVGDVIADGWLRTTGQRGWYNETYGGGLYMTDTTWVRIHNSKSFYSGTGYIRSDGAFDREGYGGASWNTGHGAYNVAISDNASQTPLLHAYRTGQAITATGANRLFAMELLNTGSVLRYCFGGAHKFEMHSNGNFLATGEVTAYSDERLKSGIEAITRGKRLRPVTFYKDGSRHVGLIAQEVQRLCPEAVSIGDDPLGLLSLNYSGALAYGFAGVYNELDSHETRIRELERDNQTLKRENEYLKMKISSIEGRLVA